MTSNTHRAFANPPMSWLRNMSPKTTMRSQIQTTNPKNKSIVQKRLRSGYVYASIHPPM